MQVENTQTSENEPVCKVSVSIITYNQADFIQKAIDGAINQEVDFRYEIIIGDDASTDGTREILKEYKEKYPDLIKLHLHDEHWEEGIPGRLNNITNIRSAKGKYIAFCDGDDYWVSPNKLQKQTDFMEANPAYSFCFHDALYKDLAKGSGFYLSDKMFFLQKSGKFTLQDLLMGKISPPSASTFFRKQSILPLPDWFWNVYSADYILQLIAARSGPAYYFKDLKSVRIKTESSVSRQFYNSFFYAKMKKTDHQIIEQEIKSAEKYLVAYQADYYLKRSSYFYRDKNFWNALLCILISIKKDPKVLRKYFYLSISAIRFSFKRAENH